jgi:hypothetical protein
MDGRDKNGRFAKGNSGGPGNPFARRVAQLRAVLMESVTDDDMRAVVRTLVTLAKAGDVAAIKLLFERLLGRVAATTADDEESDEAIREEFVREACDIRARAPEDRRRLLAGLAIFAGCGDMLTEEAAKLAELPPGANAG